MRRVSTAALLLGVIGCGRIGYEPLVVDGDAGVDAPVEVDADPDATAIWFPTTCDQPVDLGALDHGGALMALDVTPTATGFVLGYAADGAGVDVIGLAASASHELQIIQSNTPGAGQTSLEFALAALGDDVMLAVDDAADGEVHFFNLDRFGYTRTGPQALPGVRAHGFDFLVADPGRDQFVAILTTGAITDGYVLDHDAVVGAGPTMEFPTTTEAAAASPSPAGYAVINGRSSNCDVVPTTGTLTPSAASQSIDMTCHNATIATSSTGIAVAAWNCDNDQVWTTAGALPGALPPYRSLYGGGADSASNPRLAVTPDRVWYGFQVTGNRLGRAILDATGADAAGGAAVIVHTATDLKAYDLVARDGQPFLFWIDGDAGYRLWAMRLCP